MQRQDIIDEQLTDLPSSVTFCDRCVVSNQRPRIHFEDGICGACLFNDIKENDIDWDQREQELRDSVMNIDAQMVSMTLWFR